MGPSWIDDLKVSAPVRVALQRNKFTEHNFLSVLDDNDVSRQMLLRFPVDVLA